MITKIISGGQTGADRAGLDIAISLNILHGGHCPKGRRSEDGIIPDKYKVRETYSSSYVVRTSLNVKNSDGTVVFCYGRPTKGSALTIKEARLHHKPVLQVDLSRGIEHSTEKLTHWLKYYKIEVLNCAGSRASTALEENKDIEADVREIMEKTLKVVGYETTNYLGYGDSTSTSNTLKD